MKLMLEETPRPAHNVRVSQRAAVWSQECWQQSTIFLLLQHITGRGLPLWPTASWTNHNAALPWSHPIIASRAGTEGSKPERESQKMTSRLRWSREQLGHREKKEISETRAVFFFPSLGFSSNQDAQKRRSARASLDAFSAFTLLLRLLEM